MCSEKYLTAMVEALQAYTPDGLDLDDHIRHMLQDARASFQSHLQHNSSSSSSSNSSSGSSNSICSHHSDSVLSCRPNSSASSGSITAADSVPSVPSVASSGSSTAEYMMFWWQLFMTTLLVLFFLSCISQFAQYYQLTLDREDSNKLRKRLPHAIRQLIASPNSGKLKLPPPTPHKKRHSLHQQQQEQQQEQPSTPAAKTGTHLQFHSPEPSKQHNKKHE